MFCPRLSGPTLPHRPPRTPEGPRALAVLTAHFCAVFPLDNGHLLSPSAHAPSSGVRRSRFRGRMLPVQGSAFYPPRGSVLRPPGLWLGFRSQAWGGAQPGEDSLVGMTRALHLCQHCDQHSRGQDCREGARTTVGGAGGALAPHISWAVGMVMALLTIRPMSPTVQGSEEPPTSPSPPGKAVTMVGSEGPGPGQAVGEASLQDSGWWRGQGMHCSRPLGSCTRKFPSDAGRDLQKGCVAVYYDCPGF